MLELAQQLPEFPSVEAMYGCGGNTAPSDQPVYAFLDKKRSEGKPFKVYMTATASKFLSFYYAVVNEPLAGIATKKLNPLETMTVVA